MWEVRARIDRSVAAPYAIATARNLVLSQRRQEVLHERHRHKLLSPPPGPFPEEAALEQEEQAAAAGALQALDDSDRDLLHTYYAVPVEPGTQSATRLQDTAEPRGRGVTSRLARARARARVAYLLELRRIELPTSRCAATLEALSSGDRRLQRRVGAPEHLLRCRTCAGCAPALLQRRRVLYGLLPVPLLIALRPVRRAHARAPRTTSAGAAAVAVAVTVIGVMASPLLPRSLLSATAATAGAGTPASSAPAAGVPGSRVVVDDELVPASGWGGNVTDVDGARVQGARVLVQAVPGDEGFWVGGAGGRFWVEIAVQGESPLRVQVGATVSFTGTAVRFPPGAVPKTAAGADRAELVAQGGYVSVGAADLTIEGRPGD